MLLNVKTVHETLIIALKSDGSLWAWGSNYWGQLCDGTTNDSYIPKKITTIGNIEITIVYFTIIILFFISFIIVIRKVKKRKETGDQNR